jgi:hypothetical protein
MKQQKNKFSEQELIDVYNQQKHLGKIAAHFKVPIVEVWRKCKQLNLKFDDKRNGRGIKIPTEEILEGLHPYYQTLKLKHRLIKEKLIEYKCVSCKISEWNNKPITLQLDHINGDCSDHRRENLQLLCPNCHSQTETWCGKNK